MIFGAHQRHKHTRPRQEFAQPKSIRVRKSTKRNIVQSSAHTAHGRDQLVRRPRASWAAQGVQTTRYVGIFYKAASSAEQGDKAIKGDIFAKGLTLLLCSIVASVRALNERCTLKAINWQNTAKTALHTECARSRSVTGIYCHPGVDHANTRALELTVRFFVWAHSGTKHCDWRKVLQTVVLATV